MWIKTKGGAKIEDKRCIAFYSDKIVNIDLTPYINRLLKIYEKTDIMVINDALKYSEGEYVSCIENMC